jgi:ribosomal protein S18 acetylase RimI-like enzyme
VIQNQSVEIHIRLSQKSDLPEYTKLLQRTYVVAYTYPKIGLTEDCFSPEVFHSSSTQEHLIKNLHVNDRQKCWLAFLGNVLVGSISIQERDDDFELRGFYVNPKFQGKGIGKKLWELARTFASGKDITCDIYTHNVKTIGIYKKWGFVVDEKRGTFYRHWPEWPEGLQAKCLYMRYKVK